MEFCKKGFIGSSQRERLLQYEFIRLSCRGKKAMFVRNENYATFLHSKWDLVGDTAMSQ